MTTRLDRLLLLLDTGSTPVTRKAAALQLGEVQKLHPHELPNLLSRVHVFLKSSNWDTRIAAGQAIEAIVKNVPKWDPTANNVKDEPAGSSSGSNASSVDGSLQFSQFDIRRVLQHGEALVGSAGDEYDIIDEELQGLDPKERVAHQQAQVRKRLGLDMIPGVDLGMNEIIDDDVINAIKETYKKPPPKKQRSFEGKSTADVVAAEIAAISSSSGISSREKNRLKRKAKILAKQKSRESSDPPLTPTINSDEFSDDPMSKKRRTASVVVDQPADPDKIVVDSIAADSSAIFEESGEWPFEWFCYELAHDLFHQSWEVRHGAATGLREIIKHHGSSAGKSVDTPVNEMMLYNLLWLEDMALRLLCVFALDRFADFVSDEVVAPVRATCAQTLGVILKHMDINSVKNVLSVLLTLLAESQWEVRQGGLLGLKYLLAVRQDMTNQVLPLILEPVIAELEDVDDDVRAVAAAALLPVSESLVTLVPEKLPGILCILWDTLLDLDDLTASTNSIMLLLASMVACPLVTMDTMITACQGESLSTLVPRVWPFLRHSITSVRSASLKTLKTLLSSKLRSGTNNHWILPILQDALRHIYQRFILEPDPSVLQLVYEVWEDILKNSSSSDLAFACIPCIHGWLVMLTNPASVPIDKSLLIQAEHRAQHTKDKGIIKSRQVAPPSEPSPVLIGGVTTRTNETAVLRARIAAARGLGLLASKLNEQGVDVLSQTLMIPLNSVSAIQRITAAIIVTEWAEINQGLKCPDMVCQRLLTILTEQLLYDEVAVLNSRLQADCQSLLIGLLDKGIDASGGVQPGCYTIDTAAHLATTVFTEVTKAFPSKDAKALEGKRRHLLVTIGQLQSEYLKLHTRVQASAAGGLISLNQLPEKLNPIIRPIMDAVKREEELLMQKRAAASLTKLLEFCISRKSCPNSKIVKNLCTFVCGDPAQTPKVNVQENVEPPPSPATPSPVTPSPNMNAAYNRDCNSPVPFCNQMDGILTLVKQHKSALAAAAVRKSASNLTKLKSLGSSSDSVPIVSPDVQAEEHDDSAKIAAVQRRGAEMAITTLAAHFKASLPVQLPKLWEAMVGDLLANVRPDNLATEHFIDDGIAHTLVNALQIFEVVTPYLDSSLYPKIVELLPHLIKCLQVPYTAVRHMAARCMGVMSTVVTMETMQVVVQDVIELVQTGDNPINRQGAMEALAHVISKLGMKLIPYIVLLIVPVLGRMSDQCESVRLVASQCFATLVSLMPLESGVADPPEMCKDLAAKRIRERRFLEQLLDGSKLENFHISVPIKAELRKYQQDGVNWLAFLNRYKLQGILCDDMGLGKTLQSICIMAGDYHNKVAKIKESGSSDSKPSPSLVICPPTLTGHWVYEVEKFISKDYLNPLHYTGPPSERQRLRNKVKKHNLVVASYDIVRNDSDFFLSVNWNYCILDEGHIIKNGKTKLSKVIKQIKASHRLILSGTPIQNNVLELWSLFDFLMPGFLGTEKQFQAQYGKPILQSRDAKSSSKEQEAGALAMEGLHRQVLPFLLRRLKEDVLQDLPPKIIQDYYCELSPLQVQLYEDFAKSRAKKGIEESFTLSGVSEESSSKPKKGATHIFQALQYLRKVCNHPMLVLTPQHPEFERISFNLQQQKTSLRDIQHAAKLVALRQLLLDCGIGMISAADNSNDVLSDPVVSQHRVLLFCQLKSMLDIIENDLFKNYMPTVTYLRLDGGTPAGSRHSIVHRFNNDPSIDILLLTTHVGGLGLNLTGADTVIFVEHDWNPMKDLQAMDRAHRIGQKKVVNVYRLITRGTLEEKIMGLQKFKLNIANTVITQDNSSLQTMDTGQLLDLFSVEQQSNKTEQSNDRSLTNNTSSLKSVMETLGDLWEEKQYESEYNLDSFMQSLD